MWTLKRRKWREVFGLYLEHRSTIRVVEELARRGRRTRAWMTRNGRRIGGVPFTTGKVPNILTNIAYTGKVWWEGRLYPGEHNPIVSDETFHAAAEILARNRHGPAYLARCRDGALLDGILRCRCCEAAMGHFSVRHRGRTYRYYTCTNAKTRGGRTCPTKVVSAAAIEEAVVSALCCLAADDERPRAPGGSPGDGAERRGSVPTHPLGRALSVFEAGSQALPASHRARILHALLEEVAYDGRDGSIRLTLSRAGARHLAWNGAFEGGTKPLGAQGPSGHSLQETNRGGSHRD